VARVRRIRVVIEIEDDDGSVSVHEVDGTPRYGTVASIIPHHQARIHRRAGLVEPLVIVDARVHVEAVIDHPMFRVTEGEPTARYLEALPEAEVYRIIES